MSGIQSGYKNKDKNILFDIRSRILNIFHRKNYTYTDDNINHKNIIEFTINR